LTTVALKKLKLVKILLAGGAKVNHKGYDGKTALTVACSVLIEEFDHPNSLPIVRLLLLHDADPNIRDIKGRTCLMYAFQHALPLDVIDMLLTHDASPTIEDNDGNNALYFIQPTELPKYLKYFERCADFKVHCDLDMLKLREQQPDNGMSCTHDHGDKCQCQCQCQKNSYRDIKMKKNIPDSVYLNRRISEEPTSQPMKLLLRRRKCVSLPTTSANGLQTIESINTSGTTMSTHSLSKCSYPTTIMSSQRRFPYIPQINHDQQERKLRHETSQLDHIMERKLTWRHSSSHYDSSIKLPTDNSLVTDTNNANMSEIDRDIMKNSMLRSPAKLPSIK
jgi:hypothetical protein